MSCELLTKCRTCLCDSHKFYQIYDYVDDNYKILEMLDGIVPQIDIKTSSNYSSLVCQSCVDKLLAGYKFQKLCIETNKRLRDLMPLSLFETVPKLGKILDPLTEASSKTKIDVEDDAGFECELEETSDNDNDVEQSHNTDNDTDSSNAKLSVLKERKAHKSSSKSNEGERPIQNNRRKGQFPCSESEKDVEKLKSLINETDLDMEEVSTHIVKEETKLTPQIFAEQQDLSAHCKTHTHNTAEANLVCPICAKEFGNTISLKRHSRTHRAKSRVLCTECGGTFRNLYALREHKDRHNDLRNYQCPECPIRFNSPYDLKEHAQTHTKVKPHVCDICSSRFKGLRSLRNHKKLHSERPFKCDQCGKKFALMSHLRHHMITHTVEKPHKCKFCDRAFKIIGALTAHLRTHVGENTYMCDECPMTFKKHLELKQHQSEHYKKLAQRHQSIQNHNQKIIISAQNHHITIENFKSSANISGVSP